MRVRNCSTSTRSRYVEDRAESAHHSRYGQQSYEEMYMKINPLEAAVASKNKSKDIHLPTIDVNFGSNRILYVVSFLFFNDLPITLSEDLARLLRSLTDVVTVSLVATVSESPRFSGISPCERCQFLLTSVSCSSSKRCVNSYVDLIPTLDSIKIIGDDTLAIDSVLKADVWRDVLMKEEAALNARLQELEAENDEKRFDDARDEAQTRLTEVHARLAEMEAESGPARAAALLAGKSLLNVRVYACSMTM